MTIVSLSFDIGISASINITYYYDDGYDDGYVVNTGVWRRWA